MAHVCVFICVRNNEGGPSINTYVTPGEATGFASGTLYLWGGSDSHRDLKEVAKHLTRSPQKKASRPGGGNRAENGGGST